MKLEEAYRSLIHDSNIEPPDKLWENIATEMDLNNVWGEISYHMDSTRMARLENIALGTAFLGMVVSMLLVLTSPSIESRPSETLLSDNEFQSGSTDRGISTDQNDNASTPTYDRAVGPDSDSSRVSEVSNPTASTQIFTEVAKQPISYGFKRADLTVKLHSLEPTKPISQTGSNLALLRPSKPVLKTDSDLNKPQTNTSVFIGVTGSVQNTWLINDKTLRGFDANELHTSKAVFGVELGFISGLRTAHHLVQIEYFPTSTYSQGYQEYIGGHYTTRKVQVEYARLGVLFGARVGRQNKNTADILAGPYVGFLKRAWESRPGLTSNLTSSYKDRLWGIWLGYQKNIAVSDFFTISGGVRLNYGLTNIYNGTQLIPASFRITHPAAIRLSTSIYYRLGQ